MNMNEHPNTKKIYKKPIVVAVGFVVLVVIYFGVLKIDEMSLRAYSQNSAKKNLKSIGLALHNYHDVHRVFPMGGVIVEREELDSGWDKQTGPFTFQLPMINIPDPKIFATWDVPLESDAFVNEAFDETHDTNGNPLNHYSANSHLFFKNSSTRIKDISDGLENTIFVGEIAERFKPFGDPTNYRDPAKGLNKGPDTFGRPTGDGAYFVMGDGSVRFIDNDVDPKILKALATPAGGE